MNTNKLVHMMTEVWFASLKPAEIAEKLREIADELDARVESGELKNLSEAQRRSKGN